MLLTVVALVQMKQNALVEMEQERIVQFATESRI